jgi:hypothetical protein
VPFRTKTLYFNVWDSNRLQNNETNREFDIRDPVKVSFHLKDPNSNFLQLDTLTPTRFNDCPLCYAAAYQLHRFVADEFPVGMQRNVFTQEAVDLGRILVGCLNAV